MTPAPVLISVILDKSGSMETKQADVIGGFKRFLEDQRKVPGFARMIVTQFNTEVTPPTPAVPIHEMLPLSHDTYTPGGGTALFDAVAQTVSRADAEARPEDRVLCLIITDGEENSSRETTIEQVRTIIREREARGNWTFAYLGAAPDAWIRETGSSRGSSRSFDDDDPGISFMLASESTGRFRSSPLRSTRAFFEPDDPGEEQPDARPDDPSAGPRSTDA